MSEKQVPPWARLVHLGTIKAPVPNTDEEEPRWKDLCAAYADLDPRKAERFLARMPQTLVDDCSDEDLADFYRDWFEAPGDPPLSLGLGEEGDGLFFSIMAEYYRGGVGCVTSALEVEGFVFLRRPYEARHTLGPEATIPFQLWPAELPSNGEAAKEPPLFVIEARLAAPLPEGIATTEEAERRLLARLRPAFALLKQGDQLRAAQVCLGGVTIPGVPGAAAHEALTPR
jgi:hypothetical protein